ncbi:hypothetical protein HAINFHK1212_1455, partial [Haemophilus influenzae HK1212]
FSTAKIHNVMTNNNLSIKTDTTKEFISQMVP